MNKLLTFLILFIAAIPAPAQIITTIAGTGVNGFSGDGGQSTAATLNYPYCIFMDRRGNAYISDVDNNRIRKIDHAGIISTFAGTGTPGYTGDGGPATAAQIAHVLGGCADSAGNVYLADESQNCVRKISPSGIITTFAGTGALGFSGDGGQATAATLRSPYGVVADTNGNIFIADLNNNRIRKVDVAGIITTWAGSGLPGFSGDGGPATAAKVGPASLAIDGSGDMLICDWSNLRIRKINPAGIITTIAGNGLAAFVDGAAATSSGINNPYGVYADCSGNVYISEYVGFRVLYVNTSGIIHVFAGTGVGGYSGDGGPATAAQVAAPYGIYVDSVGSVYIGDIADNCIRKVTNAAPPATITGPSALCVSTAISLAASVPGGFWGHQDVSTAVTGSGMVTGISPGLDTITYNSCSSGTAFFPVSVDAAPAAGVITGADSLCTGTASLMMETISGGVWSSGSTTIATIGTSGNAMGMMPGTDTIFYTVTNLCGSATAHYVIEVDTVPSAGTVTGPAAICAATSYPMADTASGGVWSSSTATIATIDTSGSVTGIMPGADTIFYTVTNLCGSAAAYHVLGVETAPSAGTITGADSLCTGAAALMTDTATGGLWSSSTTAIATIGSSGNALGIVPGVDTILYSVTNSCGTVTAYHLLEVDPAPAAGIITGPDTLCPGAAALMADTAPGGLWSSSNTAIATIGTSGSAIGVIPGIDTIFYTVTNSCGTAVASHILDIVVCDTGISLATPGFLSGSYIIIAPNPNNGEFTIKSATNPSAGETSDITVTDAIGQTIYKHKFVSKNGELNERIQLTSSPASGVYLITVYSKTETKKIRLLIEK